MNTSRDIEKLFDHFGGNAGDYQEIGRENEARSARTRWPLLATLDFSQPPIPTVTERGGVQLPRGFTPAGNTGTGTDTPRPAATPIGRGKPPLFARAHRRSIPPVANVAIPETPAGASRFGDLSDLSEAAAQPVRVAPAPTPAPVQAPAPVQPAAFAPAAVPPPVVKPQPAVAAQPSFTKTPGPSILGKLFTAPATQPIAALPDAPLSSVFDRLRATPANSRPETETQTPARPWPASRIPRK